MTKKIFLLICLAGILTVVSACCKNEYKITGPYDFKALRLNSDKHEVVEIIDFPFTLLYNSNWEAISLLNDFGFINKTYATTCGRIFQNTIKEDKIQLFCDRDFLYDTDTIKAGSDLLSIPDLRPQLQEGVTVKIDFTQEFIDKLKLPKDFYTFTISLETTDNMLFETSEKLYLDF